MSKIEKANTPPSGPWLGFYLEKHHAKKAWMNLFLDFGNNQILGQGTDYVGPWSISGVLAPDSRECDWTKQYVGKHSVRYQGTWSETGIRGRWSIGSLISGDFHIWPAELTEIQAAYLEQETQLNPVSKNR